MVKIVYLLAVILIMGCAENPETKNIPVELGNNPAVLFCPQDNCSGHLSDLIASSKSYAHCAFFELNMEDVVSALEEKSKTADVKVVIDEQSFKGQISKKITRTDTKSQLSHNKFCIIDGKAVWTGSFNPTHNDNFYNNNNVIFINSGYIAYNYEQEFSELWSGMFGEGKNVKYPVIQFNNKTIENYFCPEDRCADQVIREIRKAKKSIYFMAFSFTNEEIADALLFKNLTDIKGVFEKTQAGSDYSQYHRLKGFGMNVMLDKNKRNMHHKVFIIDNETVITGSFNPTSNADKRNDENILILHDREIAKKYLREFGRVWPG